MPKLNKKNAKAAEEAESITMLVDAGPYACVLNKVDAKQGTAGEYWEWEFAIMEDAEGEPVEGKPKLWENTSLSEKAIFRVKQMFEAFEVPVDTDTDELVGQWVGINVGQEVAKQGSRAGQLRNIFLSAFPLGDGEEEDEEG